MSLHVHCCLFITKLLKIKIFTLNLYYGSHNATQYNVCFRCYYYTHKTKRILEKLFVLL